MCLYSYNTFTPILKPDIWGELVVEEGAAASDDSLSSAAESSLTGYRPQHTLVSRRLRHTRIVCVIVTPNRALSADCSYPLDFPICVKSERKYPACVKSGRLRKCEVSETVYNCYYGRCRIVSWSVFWSDARARVHTFRGKLW